MECSPEEVSALLDGELAPECEAEVRAHLGTCPECARLKRVLRESDQALRARGALVPESLRARLRSAAAPPRAARWGRLSRAAAVLLVAGAAAWVGARTLFFEKESQPDPLAAYATQQAWLDALELEAASLRLELETEGLEPETKARFENAARSIFDQLKRAREESRLLVASAGTFPTDTTEKNR